MSQDWGIRPHSLSGWFKFLGIKWPIRFIGKESMRGQLTLKRRQGRHKSSVRQRISWLQKHLAKYEALDTAVMKRAIVEAMKEDGLIAKTTYWRDVHLDALIALMRKEQV
jgi:hypothetical protein